MSFKPLRALVGVIAALASLYVIYGTFGTAMMVFKSNALASLPHFNLSAGWLAIGTTSADNFDLFFGCFWVIGVSLIVYAIISTISSTDYDRLGQ